VAASRSDRRRPAAPPARPQGRPGAPLAAESAPPWMQDLLAERAALEIEAISRRMVKERLVVFFGRSTFSDNTKYVFLRALARGRDYDVVWATPHRRLAQELTLAGLPAFDLSADRDASLAVLLRAAVAVFCVNPLESTGGDHLLPAALDGAEKVQLWHGVSAKRLVLQLVGHLNVTLPSMRQPWELTSRADLVLSTGEELDRFWRAVFGTRQLVRAGLPRNEVLLREPRPEELTGAMMPSDVMTALTSPARRKILLMPTWQRHADPALTADAIRGIGGIGAEFRAWGAARGVDIFVKQHPVYAGQAGPAAPTGATGGTGPGLYVIDAGVDVYPWLRCFDALVTDYSSVMFDFLLTGRPVGRLDVDRGRTFEPDFSLVPGGVGFAHTLTLGAIGPALDAMIDRAGLDGDPLAPARAAAATRLLGTRPASACDDVLDVVDDLVERRTAQDWLVVN